jgi:hypothetical protein
MVEQLSPLAPVLRPGRHAQGDGAIGVTLAETQPGSIVQLAAWRGEEGAMISTIRDVTGLALVKGGKKRHGTRAFISDPIRGRYGPVEIVSHHFFDPEGKRMHG